MSSRILVIDDEPQILRAMATNLRARDFTVDLAHTGREGLRLAADHRPDLVIVDLGLPDLDGVEVVAGLRGWTNIPIIVLSVRDAESDKVAALDAGADDYLTKPFGMRELVARVAALLRRVDRAPVLAAERGRRVFTVGAVVCDTGARRVTVDGSDVSLTQTEFDLLACLASTPGQVWSRERLLSDVWDWPDATGTRTVDSHVKALRAKIGAGRVRTVHGVGYALEPG